MPTPTVIQPDAPSLANLRAANGVLFWLKADGTLVLANETTPLPVTATVTSESTAEATASAPTYTEGQDAPLSQDLKGNLRVGQAPATATARLVSSAATTNATVALASAGVLGCITGFNSNASTRYLKIYNKATAPDENDTPRLTIPLPGGAPFELVGPPGGRSFAAGISYRLTTGSADNDTGAVSAGDILGLNLDYRT